MKSGIIADVWSKLGSGTRDALYALKHSFGGLSELGTAQRRGDYGTIMDPMKKWMIGRGTTRKPVFRGTPDLGGLSNVSPGTGLTPISFAPASGSRPRTGSEVFMGGLDASRMRRGAIWGAGLLMGGGIVSGMMGGPGLGDVARGAGVVGGIAAYRYGAARFGHRKVLGAAAGLAGLYGGSRIADQYLGVNPLIAAGAMAGLGVAGRRGAIMGSWRGGIAGRGIGRLAGGAAGGAAGWPMGISASIAGAGLGAKAVGGIGKGIGSTIGGVTGGVAGVLAAPFRGAHFVGKHLGAKSMKGRLSLGVGAVAGGLGAMNYMKTGNVFGSMATAPGLPSINLETFGASTGMRPRPPASIAHMYGMPY